MIISAKYCNLQVGFVHAEDHFWSEEEQQHTGNGRAYKSVSLGWKKRKT